MPQTARQNWPYPEENEDPFWESFIAMIQAMDASVYASREDKNHVLTDGGTISWNAALGLLSWSADIGIQAATTGFVCNVPGTGLGSSITLADREFLYVQLTRGPQSTQALTPQKASKLPAGDDYLVLAYRSGTRVYWRGGAVMNDGETLSNFSTVGDLLGDVIGPARSNVANRLKGAFMSVKGNELQLSKAVIVVPGSFPIVASIANGPVFYIARKGTDDILVGASGSFTQVVLPDGTQPTALTVGGGSIWVGGGTAKVYRIDTVTLKITGTFNLPAPMTGVSKIVYDGTSVWVCQRSAAAIVQIDLATATLTSWPVGANGFHDMVDNSLYLICSGLGRVTRFVKSNGSLTDFAPPVAGGELVELELMAGANKIGVLDKTNARYYRYDIVSYTFDAVNLSLVTSNPVSMAYDGTRIVVAFAPASPPGVAREIVNPAGAAALGWNVNLAAGSVPTSVAYSASGNQFWVGEDQTDQMEALTPATGANPADVMLGGKLGYGDVGGILPTRINYVGVAGAITTDQATWQDIGAIYFDPSTIFAGSSGITRTVTVEGILLSSDPGAEYEMRLYNLTDGEAVTGATFGPSPATTAEPNESAALTVGAAAGNIKTTAKTYVFQLQKVGGAPTDFVTCLMAQLVVRYSN
jgi:streptogramin lyase